MKVYITESGWDYEGSTITGVYATSELASAALDAAAAENDLDDYFFPDKWSYTPIDFSLAEVNQEVYRRNDSWMSISTYEVDGA